LRKIRGTKGNKFILKTIVMVEEYWLAYLLMFFCGLLGVLLGFLLGKLASFYIILIVVIFLALVTVGLFIAWSINQRDQLLGQHLLQESLKQQYNAFCLLIGELEYNLGVEHGEFISDKAWQSLKYEWAFFPSHIYEEL